MKNPEIIRYKDRLDSLFDQISTITGDIELRSHWAKYLCVLVSGFIETSVRAIYNQYAKEKASPFIANYVASKLKVLMNPKMEEILKLAGSFNPNWRNELEKNTQGELKDAIDSVVANRNQIAHGINIGLTYVTIKTYYKNAVKVIELVENTCI